MAMWRFTYEILLNSAAVGLSHLFIGLCLLDVFWVDWQAEIHSEQVETLSLDLVAPHVVWPGSLDLNCLILPVYLRNTNCNLSPLSCQVQSHQSFCDKRWTVNNECEEDFLMSVFLFLQLLPPLSVQKVTSTHLQIYFFNSKWKFKLKVLLI